MKTQINDLLLKMQTGENCIGETANHLLNLFGVSHQRELLKIIFDKHLEETGYIDLRIDEANALLDNF